ncbi:response regulator [Pedobacter xixiisoli]|uniref:response regulator n=1 Tax=Pedobacter xixiisoli TaxID=1476464 RepID=UPI000BE326FE|nr:response regulator transcription factor [Pedobacter xixiisoli]
MRLFSPEEYNGQKRNVGFDVLNALFSLWIVIWLIGAMRITIVDDHRLLSELLKLSLSEFDFIEAIHVYNSAENYLAHVEVIHADILIVDMIMPGVNGIDVIKHCRKIRKKSDLKILMLSTVIDTNSIREAFIAGANGYLCKDASIEELIKAIKFVHHEENKSYIGESIRDLLLQSQLFEAVKFSLSPREKELLNLICNGRTMKEVAADLALSKNTVQSYMKQLMRKMEVNRTPDLILKAIKYGLFHPSSIA